MPLDLFSRKLVLLVEDEPLIALDVERDLRTAGARVIAAGYLDAALYMTEHPDLSGAVVDLRLGADSAMPICRRLADRKLPFVVHTGYAADAVEREWPSVPIIQKPSWPTRSPTRSRGLFPPPSIDEKPAPGSSTRTALIVECLFRDGSQPQQ